MVQKDPASGIPGAVDYLFGNSNIYVQLVGSPGYDASCNDGILIPDPCGRKIYAGGLGRKIH
jgi:hypothetical protein